jgi:THO complex subunit 3
MPFIPCICRYQVNELAFLGACGTPSRLLLQATGNNNQVEVLQWPDYKRVATLRGHTAPVLSMGIDAAERYIATGGGDAVVGLWDAEDFICLRTYTQMDSSIRALCFSHDSRYLAMAGEDPSVFVEDVERGTSLGRVMLRGSAEDCAWHPKAHVLAYPIEIANAAHIEFRVPSQTEG